MVDRRERALDWVRGAQVLPVLGGEVVEGDQRLRFGLGHPDLLERAFGFRLQALWKLVQDVGSLVHPAALAARLGPDLLKSLPEAECAIRHCEFRSDGQPAPPEVEQQLPPGLRALAHAIRQANKLLLAFWGGAN